MRIHLHKFAALCMVLLMFTSCVKQEQNAATADIRRNGEVIQTVSLDVDAEYKIDGYGGGYNIIKVENGRIFVSEADCPEQLCVHEGERGQGLDNRLPIVCLPHRIEIVVK